MIIALDLLQFQPYLKTKKENGNSYLFCPIRKKYLVLQPEELVRQLLLVFLMEKKSYPKSRIAVEKSLIINELNRRFDVLIYDEKTEPYLLVECKAPEIKITQSTFEQIAQYNLALQVPYLLVTNGISTFVCEMDYENKNFHFMNEIPSPG